MPELIKLRVKVVDQLSNTTCDENFLTTSVIIHIKIPTYTKYSFIKIFQTSQRFFANPENLDIWRFMVLRWKTRRHPKYSLQWPEGRDQMHFQYEVQSKYLSTTSQKSIFCRILCISSDHSIQTFEKNSFSLSFNVRALLQIVPS